VHSADHRHSVIGLRDATRQAMTADGRHCVFPLRHFMAIQLVGFEAGHARRARTGLAAFRTLVFSTGFMVGTDLHCGHFLAAQVSSEGARNHLTRRCSQRLRRRCVLCPA
jgi:hypothetical protein